MDRSSDHHDDYGGLGYGTFCRYDDLVLVQELTAVLLTVGGSLWMLENAVQHTIANNKRETCQQDFPKVPIEMDGSEETMDGLVG